MSTQVPSAPTSSPPYWAEEVPGPGGQAQFRVKIGGLHCSVCTGTIVLKG